MHERVLEGFRIFVPGKPAHKGSTRSFAFVRVATKRAVGSTPLARWKFQMCWNIFFGPCSARYT